MADGNETDLGRRDLIKLGAAATVAVTLGIGEAVAAQSPGATAAAPSTAANTFFTRDELAMVDELSEMIIPIDEHSPGARAAKVAGYIDSRLADAWDAQERTDWREGLRRIDALAQESGGKSFMQSSPEQRLTVLTRIAKNEKDPRQPEELFFAKLKSRVVDGYYTSEIGIKQEMEYKGNSYLPEFVGVDVS
jgi:gluconate 2-dehydrogenase gamma chain